MKKPHQKGIFYVNAVVQLHNNNQNPQFNQQVQMPQGPTKYCKHCKSIIPKNAKVCPLCRRKQGGIGKWIVIAIIAVIIISALGSSGSGSDDAKATDSNTTTMTNDSAANRSDATEATPSDEPEITMGQKNALSKAKTYLKMMAFSHDGLVEQLAFDGFTEEEAVYGADNCGADWNEQAARKAESYLDLTAFSRDGLITQLEFDKFTTEQAEYAATAVGY